MELVYLWVEEYKNIKNQGFNFSPRFTCKYDQENKNLTILDKDETKEFYSKNFFGKNINVTAIVGENGSGKSSILKLITLILNNRYHNLNPFFAIYATTVDKRVIYYKQEHELNLKNNFERFDDNDLTSNWINYQYKYPEINKIIEKHSSYNQYGSLNTFKHIHIINKYKNILSIINNKYYFDTLQISIREKSSSFMDTLTFDKKNYFSEETKKFLHNFLKKYKVIDTLKDINKLLAKDKIIEYNTLLFFIHFFMLHHEDMSLQESDLITILKALENENLFDFLDSFQNKLEAKIKMPLLFKIFNNLYSNIKYLRDVQEELNVDEDNRVFFLNFNLEEKEKINEVISNTQYITGLMEEEAYYCDFINYNFLNSKKNITFNDLSDGEKEIVKVCIDFLHQMDLEKEKNKILVCDEIDNSMHPFWKKELLNILIKILEEFKKTNQHNQSTHIILTTHSQFILSDLPKENVIFLKKDKNGNCKNVTEETNIKTFGANIHTLLSHGFFMKEGLIGEFAKEKINKAIEYLNKIKLEPNEIKYCEEIISIIGEPILKRQLQKMLDSKRLAKIDKIDSILKQIKALEKELKKVQK